MSIDSHEGGGRSDTHLGVEGYDHARPHLYYNLSLSTDLGGTSLQPSHVTLSSRRCKH